MSTSRRALLSMLSAIVAFAAIIDIASARGGGGGGKGGGKHDSALSNVPIPLATGTVPTRVKTFETFQGKECRRDYKWLCPGIPIGKCDLQSKIEQLSPACKAFVEENR